MLHGLSGCQLEECFASGFMEIGNCCIAVSENPRPHSPFEKRTRTHSRNPLVLRACTTVTFEKGGAPPAPSAVAVCVTRPSRSESSMARILFGQGKLETRLVLSPVW